MLAHAASSDGRSRSRRFAALLRLLGSPGGHRRGRWLPPIAVIVACMSLWLVTLSGTASAAGVSGYHIVSATQSVAAGQGGTASATCPSGDVVLSGGYQVSDSTPGDLNYWGSAPTLADNSLSSTTWSSGIGNNTTTTQSVTAYAVCASSSIAGYSEQSQSLSMAANSATDGNLACPAGDVVVGGGWLGGPGFVDDSDPSKSSSISTTNWDVFFDGTQSGATGGTVYAICISNSVSGFSDQLNQTFNAGTISQSCPAGQVAIGGGFEGKNPSLVAPVDANGAISTSTWSVTNANPGGGVNGVVTICADAQPTVSFLKPSSGAAAGGTNVVIGGNGLSGATKVLFGNVPATRFTVGSDSQINAVAPAGTGTVDVTVVSPGGTSATSPGDQYTYLPSVTGISPASGPAAGGTAVTITGVGFTNATAVNFGSTPGTLVKINSDTSISAISPAGTGVVDVTVTTPTSTSQTSAADRYTYVPAPTVTGVSPGAGPTGGGNTVTITGTNLGSASAVKFGANAATVLTNSATQITATAPAGSAGTVDVTVTTAGGTSATSSADHYTYVPAPTVTGVSPGSGPLGGGNTVTITGTNLGSASAVKFGSNAATVLTDTATQITARAPAGAAGTVDVTVTTAGGTSATGNADKYTYTAAPTVTGVSPSAGPLAGGNTVTITGTNLAGASAVKFGSNAASVLTDTATQITAKAPAGAVGTVDITVTTAGGTSATGNADKYTYTAAPTVTGVSPSAGPLAGGNTVTITGTNLAGASAVKFGSNAASVLTDTATQITAKAPAGAAGTVDVTVTTAGGTSATGNADKYTYTAAPAVTGVSPGSGPTAGGTGVTITGTNLANASAVKFGANAATVVTDTATQITATAPAGAAGTVDVTVTTPGGTSPTNSADQFTYAAPSGGGPVGSSGSTGFVPISPAVSSAPPTVMGSTGAGFSGFVNPQGLGTTAYFQYGLDAAYGAASDGPIYTAQTPAQQLPADATAHQVSASVSGLVPNAVYHVRLVATNSAGTTYGPDQAFTTRQDPAPPPPVLGQSVDVKPVSGVVFIKLPGALASDGARGSRLVSHQVLTKGVGFVPLTEARQLPTGTQIDARLGTLQLTAAAATKHGKLQPGIFGGGLFGFAQDRRGVTKGLTTLSLLEGAFAGAPTYASCKAGKAADRSAPGAHAAALSGKVLQTLHGSDHGGRFRTRGHYSAATVRGTVWTMSDRCDGTLTTVQRGTVSVNDFVRHVTVLVHAGHHYLARARG